MTEIIATILILIAPVTLIYMLIKNARKTPEEVRKHFGADNNDINNKNKKKKKKKVKNN